MSFNITTKRRIEACIDAGLKLNGNRWYDDATESIQRYVNRSDEVDSMAAYLAIASPRVQVSRSVRIAKHFFETGKKLAGTLGSVFKKLTDYRNDPDGFKWTPKVRDFYEALIGNRSAIVVDIHISRVFGFADGYPMSTTKKAVKVRESIKRYIANRSNDTGLNPRDLQATIWCGWLRFQGLEPGRLEL